MSQEIKQLTSNQKRRLKEKAKRKKRIPVVLGSYRTRPVGIPWTGRSQSPISVQGKGTIKISNR